MKIRKTIILTIVALYSLNFKADAQFLIGGNISYSESLLSIQGGETERSSYSFSPQLGYTLKPNHLLGFRYSYVNNRSKTISDATTTSNSKSETNRYILFSRHRKPINKIINFFGELSISYSNSIQLNGSNTSTFISENTSNNYAISAAPGMELKLTPKWLLSAKWGIFQFQHSVTDYNSSTEKTKSNNLIASLNPENISIGINYLFMFERSDQINNHISK